MARFTHRIFSFQARARTVSSILRIVNGNPVNPYPNVSRHNIGVVRPDCDGPLTTRMGSS